MSGLLPNYHIFNSARGELFQDYSLGSVTEHVKENCFRITVLGKEQCFRRTISGLHSKDHVFNSAGGEPQGRDSCQSDSQREIREADIQHC